MIRYLLISILFICCSGLIGQDFSAYKNLIDEGNHEEVKSSLQYLNSQYPTYPFVMYLNAVMNQNGEEAYNQFNKIIEDHSGTLAAEYSLLKIGQYFYSKGLYTQASEQLKKVPLNYTESENIEWAVSLLKKSYLATGEQDSIDYYIKLFEEMYPHLNFEDYDYYSEVILPDNSISAEIVVDSVIVDEDSSNKEIVRLGDKPWVVQVGAFKQKENAEIIVERLKNSGYNIEILENNDGELYLVQIVRFARIEQAIIAGEDLNDNFGLEFRILERN